MILVSVNDFRENLFYTIMKHINHPFLYAIVENTTGAIFFMGKYGGN